MIGSLAAAVALVVVQLLVSRLRSLVSPSSGHFLSVAGGVGVAYVFARLLPELGRAATVAETATGGVLLVLQRHAFLVALAGFLIYYQALGGAQRRQQDADGSAASTFWVQVLLYLVFNVFVGYLLVHQVAPGTSELWLFVAAIAARYVVGEVALREQDPSAYDRWARWLLAAAILAGWASGLAVDLGDHVVTLLSALLTGTIILSILQQQLPSSGQARPLTFVVACTGVAAVLVLYGTY